MFPQVKACFACGCGGRTIQRVDGDWQREDSVMSIAAGNSDSEWGTFGMGHSFRPFDGHWVYFLGAIEYWISTGLYIWNPQYQWTLFTMDADFSIFIINSRNLSLQQQSFEPLSKILCHLVCSRLDLTTMAGGEHLFPRKQTVLTTRQVSMHKTCHWKML